MSAAGSADAVLETSPDAEPTRATSRAAPGAEADDSSAGSTARRLADPLTEQERQILDLERQWWKYAGAKDQAISDRLGISAVAYHQVLNRLIDAEAAQAHDPMLVKRLRRQRDARQRGRASRR
ncbi:DUF3263 domain-containing protein [Nesterenkonia sp. F]|uniref:DUF3263 domain-containing protein n=1 Tax=Nesterenkonia sp. F TaxID=795955 RepID=UPI000255D10F|nr:DUF3263 domain-containing protein [Nesterenkonia sp. F]